MEFYLKENRKNKSKITILGAGSNTLIRDKGVKGVVIKLGSGFSEIKKIESEVIEVGAGALDRKVSNFAKESFDKFLNKQDNALIIRIILKQVLHSYWIL